MIYLTQLVYIRPGQESIFEEFESVAMPLISKYNGSLLLRIRPTKDQFIEGALEMPYEIHFVQFDSEQDFEAFKTDKSRKDFLHLKEASVSSQLLVKGVKL